MSKPRALFLLPPAWAAKGKAAFAGPHYEALFPDDAFAPGDVDYVVGSKPPPGYLATLPRLKLAISLGAGVDGFLADPAYPRHVPLARFTDPSLALEMAQYVTMHILMLHRHQRHFDEAQAAHRWGWMPLPRPTDLTRIGILGLGEIGGKIAERLALYGFQVSGWSRSPKTFAGVTSYAGDAALADFLGQCDFVAAVVPLTPQTRHMMNAAFFAKLPRGAVVLNVARGAVLVEPDLVAALDSGHLAHAVLDVFETEPLPPESPLWDHPKITITPHVAGMTDPRMAMAYVADCIAKTEAGEQLDDLVDFTRGY